MDDNSGAREEDNNLYLSVGGGLDEDLLNVPVVVIGEAVYLEVGDFVCREAAQVGVTQEDPPGVDAEAPVKQLVVSNKVLPYEESTAGEVAWETGSPRRR